MGRRLPADMDLSAVLRPGDRIVVGHGCGEPQSLTEALAAQRANLGGVGLFMASAFSTTFQPEHADHIGFSSMGALGGLARLARAGVLDIVPCHVGQVGRMISDGRIGCDVAMVQLSPCGPDGRHSFGLISDHVRAAIAKADRVVAEINHQTPWTHGDDGLAADEIDGFVETSRPPVTVRPSVIGEVERAIAAHAAAWIEDGAVLQMGIGSIPDAILRQLDGHRDLGVHSGMIGDGVMALMEAGAVTNAGKSIHRGISITGALVGSEQLYRFAHLNKAIGMRSAEVTHGEAALARLEGLVSINSAIEVDLTGQVNAEQTDAAYLGATGGQVDYVRGSVRAPRGRAIIALPATARDGAVSRIVSRLSGPVTTARSEVDLIVTEHGAAELRGKSIRERIRAMIRIAHPDFQETLARDAHDMLQRGF